MKNVYLVSKPDSTRVQSLSIEEAESQIPMELGLRLSSLFMFDRLVFVEGSSDEAILREWSSRIGVNFSQSNVGFVVMGGVRNFGHYATEATLSFLRKRNVKMFFVIDRDEKDEQEIKGIRERLGDRAVVMVLERRELENYLISSVALAEFIRMKKRISGDRVPDDWPSIEEVTSAIEESAEELKQVAIDRRVKNILCRPYYPCSGLELDSPSNSSIGERVSSELRQVIEDLNQVMGRVEEVSQAQSASVEREWAARKLELVPGDILLDMVCRRFGTRFRKALDGERLAHLMPDSEIASEIRMMIREIGA